MPAASLIIILTAFAFASFLLILRSKEMHTWFLSYLIGKVKGRTAPKGPRHILFCVVDHFEPQWERPSRDVEDRRVDAWVEGYPKIAGKHRDADGVHPQHTFYYPEEEYRKEHLDKIAGLCRRGFGEVEIHLHHFDDTSVGFRDALNRFKLILKSHGQLCAGPDGRIQYGFVHGNWALDNSRRDGKKCGVNDELKILKETGCYADFTLPSAPDQTQTRKINSIYYATDDPDEPKSHDTGVDVTVGKRPSGDLMIVQGPLTLDWENRKWGILPRIENGDLADDNPPSDRRADLWIEQGVSVKGREEWIFVKVHTHGTQEATTDVLLGEPMDRTFSHLEKKYNDGHTYVLHYVNTREMYNIIKAAEDGKSGNPNEYRNYLLKKL